MREKCRIRETRGTWIVVFYDHAYFGTVSANRFATFQEAENYAKNAKIRPAFQEGWAKGYEIAYVCGGFFEEVEKA